MCRRAPKRDPGRPVPSSARPTWSDCPYFSSIRTTPTLGVEAARRRRVDEAHIAAGADVEDGAVVGEGNRGWEFAVVRGGGRIRGGGLVRPGADIRARGGGGARGESPKPPPAS